MGRGADPPRGTLGEIIRAQRRLARLSLRQLAALSAVSNPYLSQVERGVHEPSMRVLTAIADALDVSTETLMREAGLLGRTRDPVEPPAVPDVESAIRADPRLSAEQRAALVAVYRSYVAGEG